MTGDLSQFNSKSSGIVIFGDDVKVKTFGVEDVGKNSETFIYNVILIDNLDYNFLSVSQLCDKNLYVLFKKYECLVLDSNFNVIFKEKSYNDIYIIFLEKIDSSSFKHFKILSDDP